MTTTTPQEVSAGSTTVDQQPTFCPASSAFQDIRLGYDEVGKTTKALDYWKEMHPHQARLVVAYIVEAHAKNGLDLGKLKPGDPVVPQALRALKKHKQLVDRFYQVLEQANLIASSDDGVFIRTDVPIDPTPAADLYQDIIGRHPQHDAVHELVGVVGSNLAGCLAGEVDGLHLIFGNMKNKRLLNDMYEFWPLLRTPTILLGDFLVKAAAPLSSDSGRKHEGTFRILEVGAGTGGTTRHIIDRLQEQGTKFEYVFTDISTALVAAAKRRFKNVRGMSYDLLDIEKPPKPGYEGAFHCIISTNCIHATKNLDKSLRHLRRMLREDGALTLVETTQSSLCWLDIVVGLFDGWWLFEDGREYALIDEEEWARRMKRAGFEQVLWTEGNAPESKTVRLIGAFPTTD